MPLRWAAAALGLAAVGCELNPPQVQQLFWQRTVVEDRELDAIYQRLSVFVQADDADGQEDLASLFVIHDDQRLFWGFDSQTWSEVTRSGATWIGSNALSLPAGGDLPAGRYRVVVQDASGELDQQSFTLPGPPPAAAWELFAGTGIQISGSTISLTGWPQPVEVWLYPADEGGERLAAAQATDGTVDLAAMVPQRLGDRDFTVFVYAYQDPWRTSVLSGPYAWSRPDE